MSKDVQVDLEPKEVNDVVDVTEQTEGRPRLELKGDDHKRSEQLAAFVATHNEPPHLFQRSREVVRLARDGDRTVIEEMGLQQLVPHLNGRCRAYTAASPTSDRDWNKQSGVPKKCVRHYLARPNWELPQLFGVRTGPIYGPDLTLRLSTGYHAGAKFFVDLSDTQVASPPRNPTDDEVDDALENLLDGAFVDFPLEDRASQAHLLSVGLTLVLRPAIDGPTPLHLVSAPKAGSGKGMILNTWSVITQGSPASMQPVSDDDEEWRKAITSMLLEGSPLIILDNLPEGVVIDTPSLASALTTETWSDRRLGQNERVRLPNRSVWCATGNNPQLTGELARRTILIRLVPDQERPDQRDDFVHDPLLPWVREHRPKLLRSLLTLVEHWKSVGKPEPAGRLGSYDGWTKVVGGVLEACGFGDAFLGNDEQLLSQAATQDNEFSSFVEAWHELHGPTKTTSKNLVNLCEDDGFLHDVIADKTGRGKSMAIARLVSQHEDQVIKAGDGADADKVRVAIDREGKRNKYHLVAVD